MSFVYDLRTTLTFALGAAAMLTLGSLFRSDPGFTDVWLLPFSAGVVLSVLLADGIQRRWRGDPRTRQKEPDARTLSAAIAGFVGLTLVGVWSFSQGHEALTWGLLVVLGLGGVVACAWTLRGLRR